MRYKHPISAFFRLLPALSWLAAFAVALRMGVGLYPQLDTEGDWVDEIVLLGFAGVAIIALRMAYKEYKEALPAVRADTPIGLLPPVRRHPPPFTPTRYPLSDEMKTELRKLIETLQSAGMLQPGEVTPDEVIDRAETFDEWAKVDLYLALNVLHVLAGERQRPFANIAFFLEDSEMQGAHAANIVQELARLCGRSHELSTVRVRSIDGGRLVPVGSGFPPPNAIVEFELGTEHHAVPFVFYGKHVPGGLIEATTKLLTRPDDPRRFVWENFDSFLSVSYLTPTQTVMINNAEQEEFPRFAEVARRHSRAPYVHVEPG